MWKRIGWLNDGNFFVRVHLHLLWKDSITHIHGLAVYVKEEPSFVFMHSFWFCFVYHRWGSLDQPICLCVFLWRYKVHRKDALTYSGGTGRPGELCYNFSISNDLTQMINFPTRIRDCDSHSLLFWIYFISSDVSICSTMAFPPFGNSNHVVVSVSS